MTLSPSLLSDSSKTACQTRLVPAFTAAKSSTNQFLTGKHSIPRSSAYLVRRIGISQYICWVLVVQRPDMHIRIAFLRLSCPKDWDPDTHSIQATAKQPIGHVQSITQPSAYLVRRIGILSAQQPLSDQVCALLPRSFAYLVRRIVELIVQRYTNLTLKYKPL